MDTTSCMLIRNRPIIILDDDNFLAYIFVGVYVGGVTPAPFSGYVAMPRIVEVVSTVHIHDYHSLVARYYGITQTMNTEIDLEDWIRVFLDDLL